MSRPWTRLALLAALALSTPALAQDTSFTAFEDALKAGDKDGATNALVAIVEDPAQAEAHGKAWRSLAGMLESYGLEYAALVAWSKAIEADAQGASGDIGKAMELAKKLSDEAILAPVLGNNVGIQGLDGETRSRMAYLAALHHLRRDNLGTALGILMMVEQGTKVYADAQALRGVVLANQGRHNDALAPLLTAQGAANQVAPSDPVEAARFDDVVDLNVARAYYGSGNYGQAIAWFAKVSRDSEYWPEAQFERAWAHFRGEDMQGTLAQLHTHDSPFFESWYFPEADLLRAYALFMMCKFPSASEEMDQFNATYGPLKQELDRTVASLDAAAAFADARTFVEGGTPKLPAMVMRSFRNDDRFAEAIASIDAAEAELKKAPSVGTQAFVAKATSWVDARRDARIAEEGERVLDRARHSQTELGEMLQGIEITRLDLLSLEAEMYERAAVTGTLDYGDRIGKLRSMRKNRKNFRVWPFEGEFWADELGWYVVDSRPDCPESMAVGEK